MLSLFLKSDASNPASYSLPTSGFRSALPKLTGVTPPSPLLPTAGP